MYNKYIGNTGKFTRVEESPRVNAQTQRPVIKPPPPAIPPVLEHSAPERVMSEHTTSPAHSAIPHPPRVGSKNKPSLFGGLGGGLNGLLGGLGGGLKGIGGAGGLSDSFRGMFDHLPFGLDIGDILLLLLLLFFFIESGDEEFIIILAVIAYNLFKER